MRNKSECEVFNDTKGFWVNNTKGLWVNNTKGFWVNETKGLWVNESKGLWEGQITNDTNGWHGMYYSEALATILIKIDSVSLWVQLFSILLSIVSNSAVLFVSTKSRVLSLNKFVINFLSLSDLLYSFFQIFLVHRRFNYHVWSFGEALCSLSIMSPCTITTSIFLITFIAFERHRTILYPFRPKLKKSKITLLVGSLWIISFLIMLPTFLHMRVVNINGKADCTRYWNGNFPKYWDLFVFMLSYPLPLLIIVACYFRIVFQVTGRFENNSLLLKKNAPVAFRANKNKENSQHRKMIIMLATIVFSFVITTTPNQIKILWLAFAPKDGPDTQKTYLILFSLSMLVHLHSFINPIVYCVSDPKFRRMLFRSKSMNRSSKFSTTFRIRKETEFTASRYNISSSDNHCNTKSKSRQSLFKLSNLSDSLEIFRIPVKSKKWYRKSFLQPIRLWFQKKRMRNDTTATDIFFMNDIDQTEGEQGMTNSDTAETLLFMQSSM